MMGAWSATLAQPGPHSADADGAGVQKAIHVGYYPSRRRLEIRWDQLPAALVQAHATVQVRRVGAPAVLAEKTWTPADAPGPVPVEWVDLPALGDGEYQWQITWPPAPVPAPGGVTLDTGRPAVPLAMAQGTFKVRHFAWEGNDLGEEEVIYPPFTPIVVHDAAAAVVLRTYRMNGLGLWDSVTSQGRELLANPMTLHLRTADGEQAWRYAGGQWVERDPRRVVYETTASADSLTLKTRSTIEYDGCMRVEMELAPPVVATPSATAAPPIERLWLEIPLREREVPLFHNTAMEGMRNNYAGALPRGGRVTWHRRPDKPWPLSAVMPTWTAEPADRDDEVVWTCRDADPSKATLTSGFVPYVWLGGGERGLAFFGANDRGYVLDPGQPVQAIARRGDAVVLTVDLINRAGTVLTERRYITFGLQASPTRPMPANWRARHDVTAAMPGPVLCWGGYICADKYPDGANFNVVDALVDVRRTGVVDRSVFEKMDRARAEPWKKPWGGTGAPGFDAWLDRDFWWFANLAQDMHRGDDVEWVRRSYGCTPEVAGVLVRPAWVTYVEEHASDVTQPEWEVYQDEWRADWPWNEKRTVIRGQPQPENNFGYGHQAFPESYQDFALYYIREWFRRGVGVYFDNTMPYTMSNPATSQAYFDAQGRLQPACSIWEQRAYYRRVWQLMNRLRQEGAPFPLAFAQHMTNTYLLPWATWNTIDLDMEWEWFAGQAPPGRRRAAVPADVLLAETTGRQTGSMGNSHFWLQGNPRDPDQAPAAVKRTEWGMRMVHELDLRGMEAWDQALWRFGYGAADTEVYNYWGDDPPLTISDPAQNKWIMLVWPAEKRGFLVVQTWNPRDASALVTLDTTRLQWPATLRAVDVDTRQVTVVEQGRLEMELQGPYGTRVFLLEPGP